MKFARLVFMIAGIYGVIVLLPMYFLEERMGRDLPPPINHPEYYYGFIGVALACQVFFLILSTDPIRYRPLMIPAVLEKAAFVIPVSILFFQNRASFLTLVAAMPDLILGTLFLVAFLKTRSNYQLGT
jgi:hypothetical protein